MAVEAFSVRCNQCPRFRGSQRRRRRRRSKRAHKRISALCVVTLLADHWSICDSLSLISTYRGCASSSRSLAKLSAPCIFFSTPTMLASCMLDVDTRWDRMYFSVHLVGLQFWIRLPINLLQDTVFILIDILINAFLFE